MHHETTPPWDVVADGCVKGWNRRLEASVPTQQGQDAEWSQSWRTAETLAICQVKRERWKVRNDQRCER